MTVATGSGYFGSASDSFEVFVQ